MLGVGRELAGLRALESQDPDEKRRDRHVRKHVHRLWLPVDAVEELGIAHPVPGEPLLHRLVGDRLDPRHGEHGALPHVGTHRCEAEAAVADDHRGDAVPAGERQIRVPEELRVVVGVEIDEAGGDDHAARVDDPRTIRGGDPPDVRDAAGPDADVRPIALCPRSVDDDAVRFTMSKSVMRRLQWRSTSRGARTDRPSRCGR